MKKCLAGCCLLMSLCVASSCTTKNNQRTDKVETTEESAFSGVHIVPEYARGFELSYRSGYVLLDIQDPQNEESTTFHYALVRRGTKPAGIPGSYTVIETPIRSVICMTSLQLSNFIKMGELDKVVGVTSTRHLFNREMNERLKSGKTAKIGIEGNFDNEVIMSMNPDLILVSPFKRGGYETLKDVGIPLIPHLGYKEMTPLGQAEWVKFVGLLVGQEQKANEIFDAIAARYNELKELTAEGKVKKRPVVLSGEMRGGVSTAWELHQKGYAVFALRYRIGSEAKDNAPIQDLGRAIQLITANAEKFGVQTEDYALLGYSSGGQIAGVFCGQEVGYPRYNVPRPGVLLLAYPINNFYEAKPIYRWLIDTYSEDLRYYDYNISGCVTPDFPPTYFWYGLNDILLMAFNYYEQGPALQKALARNGVPYHESVYKRAFHGIGIAEGTDAEGWLNDAAAFWEEQTAQAQQPAA